MKALLAAVLLAGSLNAQTPVFLPRPVSGVSVPAPTVPSAAASNQALLNQINGTISQRFTAHQILTLQTSPAFLVPTSAQRPVPVR